MGFARVYRAETVDGQETVAVKLLRDRWAADPASVASFKREARICQRFKHPNIVPIYDVGSEDDFHYFYDGIWLRAETSRFSARSRDAFPE